jgi:hypothetical protein
MSLFTPSYLDSLSFISLYNFFFSLIDHLQSVFIPYLIQCTDLKYKITFLSFSLSFLIIE